MMVLRKCYIALVEFFIFCEEEHEDEFDKVKVLTMFAVLRTRVLFLLFRSQGPAFDVVG